MNIAQTTANVKKLIAESLCLEVPADHFHFANTSELVVERPSNVDEVIQFEAKKAAEFGLGIAQKGFHLLALGSAGLGRVDLLLRLMAQQAEIANKNLNQCHHDLIAVCCFSDETKPLLLKISAGEGKSLKLAHDYFVRHFSKVLAKSIEDKTTKNTIDQLKFAMHEAIKNIKNQCVVIEKTPALQAYYVDLQKDIDDYLDAWQSTQHHESDAHIENMLSEGFLNRYRVNLLVSHQKNSASPVIFDQDPSLLSLFGGMESSGENAQTPDFLRLRAGHLLQADGGSLLIHLRDILADEQNGAQILEKCHRYLRNGVVQLEDASSNNQGSNFFAASTVIAVNAKIVLVATREDYYDLLEATPDFFDFFPIKVEFSETVLATQKNYEAYASWIAQKCQTLSLKHCTKNSVACLMQSMHRLAEDQTRLSANLAFLEKLIIESNAIALHAQAEFIDKLHVKAALSGRYHRHDYIERMTRDTIIDQELLINVQGEAVGQVNALTHIDLAEASFGAPVRVTANCFPGSRGVVTIDREVAMSGPTHDKGVFILQSWLQHYFSRFSPLNLSANIVFEQEYSGVDGDSASCAELFALLSALTNMPMNQGVAVTGALNQHGEVLPVGGLNEKIEGYFRVCQQIGLTKQQGVLIPEKNMRHLMLSHEVTEAVKKGEFHIFTMQHVLDGVTYLMKTTQPEFDESAEQRLIYFKALIEQNRPHVISKPS
jgi:predicted ATP-dependent protease